ncbi:MAG TPA: YoaK family protein [Polyangiaceae bacterium]
MFSHEGTERSDLQNRALAGSLAFVGGFANSAGFVVLGLFTAHVTGNVGRLADDLSRARWSVALVPLGLVGLFFIGAVLVTFVVENHRFARRAYGYAVALSIEVVLLAVFALSHDDRLDAAALSVAMGLQNGLVTRLSGAVVRTTHLTGVITDLGIETARWLAYAIRRRERPNSAKVELLATIASTFTIGAIGGTALALRFGRAAMTFAILAVGICVVVAVAPRERRFFGEQRTKKNDPSAS